MDLSSLAGLGRVAGIGGIAVGALVLLLRPLIEQSGTLPPALRGWLLVTIAFGAFLVALAGIAAWVIAGRAPGQRAVAEGESSVARNVNEGKGGTQDARASGKGAIAENFGKRG